MPPKRKLQEGAVQETSKIIKAQKPTKTAAATDKKPAAAKSYKEDAPSPTKSKKKSSAPAPQAADFGSAFESLFSAPVSAKSTTDQATTGPVVKKDEKKDKKIPKETKLDSKPDSKARAKTDILNRTEKQLEAASSAFQQARDKQREKRRTEADKRKLELQKAQQEEAEREGKKEIVSTAKRMTSEMQLKAKQALIQKQREKEKVLLLEKDHVRPEYNDLEKRLARIATRGVVTLFNAVDEQQKKLEVIRSNKTLLSGQKDDMIDEEAQAGFLELLKKSASNHKQMDFEAIVPSSRKKLSAKQRLIEREEFDYDEVAKILGSDDSENTLSDSDEVKQELPQKKQSAQKKVDQKKKAKVNVVPDFLHDDYLMKNRKMKDWENDSDSSDSEGL